MGKISSKATKIKARVNSRHHNFLRELTRPVKTRRVREAEILRTIEGGWFAARTVTPLASEIAMMEEVGEISGVSSKNTIAENLRVINARIAADNEDLSELLKESKIVVPQQTIEDALCEAARILDDDLLLIGDAGNGCTETMNKVKSILEINPNTVIGIFRSRIWLDSWVEERRPTTYFDPGIYDECGDYEGASVFIDERGFSNHDHGILLAAAELRMAMNDLISSNITSAAVKKLINKQSILIDTVKNIRPKAIEERERSNQRQEFQNFAFGGFIAGASIFSLVRECQIFCV